MQIAELVREKALAADAGRGAARDQVEVEEIVERHRARGDLRRDRVAEADRRRQARARGPRDRHARPPRDRGAARPPRSILELRVKARPKWRRDEAMLEATRHLTKSAASRIGRTGRCATHSIRDKRPHRRRPPELPGQRPGAARGGGLRRRRRGERRAQRRSQAATSSIPTSSCSTCSCPTRRASRSPRTLTGDGAVRQRRPRLEPRRLRLRAARRGERGAAASCPKAELSGARIAALIP